MKTSLVASNHATHGIKADLLTLTFGFQGKMWQATWDGSPYGVYHIGIVAVDDRYYIFDWYNNSELLYSAIPHTGGNP